MLCARFYGGYHSKFPSSCVKMNMQPSNAILRFFFKAPRHLSKTDCCRDVVIVTFLVVNLVGAKLDPVALNPEMRISVFSH